MSDLIQKIFDAVRDGDFQGVKLNIESALEAGMDPSTILNEGMIAAMREVGRCFEEGEFYVPEMLIAARAMQSGMTILKPHLQKSNVKPSGKVVIGTVKGDLHDIGKNLVALMLEGDGFEIKDLGVDVPVEEFVRVLKEENPDILALSALLTTTMQMMKTTIDAVIAAGLRDQVKIIVGGAPVTEIYAMKIGADGFSPDASRAVTLAQSLLNS
jgi:5-methyltetrahydrofolate--homocysteine methyltransferase